MPRLNWDRLHIEERDARERARLARQKKWQSKRSRSLSKRRSKWRLKSKVKAPRPAWTSQRGSGSSSQIPAPPASKRMTVCPVCACPIRTDRVEKHLSRVHRSMAPATTATPRPPISPSANQKVVLRPVRRPPQKADNRTLYSLYFSPEVQHGLTLAELRLKVRQADLIERAVIRYLETLGPFVHRTPGGAGPSLVKVPKTRPQGRASQQRSEGAAAHPKSSRAVTANRKPSGRTSSSRAAVKPTRQNRKRSTSAKPTTKQKQSRVAKKKSRRLPKRAPARHTR
jgi:hypothetical protein